MLESIKQNGGTDLYDDIDHPKTIKEKTTPLLKYCFTLKPGNLLQVCLVWIVLPILFILLCLSGSILKSIFLLPTPKSLTISPSEFSESRSWTYLKNISSDIGPRPFGSTSNRKTVDFIVSELHKINSTFAKDGFRVEIVQEPFVHENYEPQMNILARISSSNSMTNLSSVMISSHFDSAGLVAGAGDNAIMVAAQLEIFRNILSKPMPPANPVIFFFNNGEEIGLVGAKDFVSKENSWAKYVKRFINLDSMSATGKELMFRASPSSLVTRYGVVPRPHASVVGEEVVQFIPSDTDFSAYVNYSRRFLSSKPNVYKLDGFDMALTSNGHYYHTLRDNLAAISSGTLQHIGENSLALLESAAYKEDLNDLKDDFLYVYFDIYGILYFHYPEFVGIVVNILLFILMIISPFAYLLIYFLIRKCHEEKKSNESTLDMDMDVHNEESKKANQKTEEFSALQSTFIIVMYVFGYILSIGLAFLCTFIISFCLSYINPLSWLSAAPFGVVLYAFPTLLGLTLGQWFTFQTSWLFCLKCINQKSINNKYYKERFLALYFILAPPLLFISIARLRSGYLYTISCLFIFGSIQLVLFFDLILTWIQENLKSKSRKFFNNSVDMSDYGDTGFGYGDLDDENKGLKLDYYQSAYSPEIPGPREKVIKCIDFTLPSFWYFIPFLAGIIPGLLIFDVFVTLLEMIVPTIGRINALNTEVFLAFLVCGIISLIFLIYLPMMSRAANFGKVCVILFLISGGLVISAMIVPPYSSIAPKRCTFIHTSANTDGIYSNGTIVEISKRIKAVLLTWDLKPAQYAMDYVNKEKLKNVECEGSRCTFELTELPLKQPVVKIISTTPEPNDATKFDVEIEYEGTDFAFLNITGDYQSVSETLPKYKMGTFTNLWNFNFVVPKNGVAMLEFAGNYLDLKYTPYLQELFQSNEKLTLMIGSVSRSYGQLKSQFLATDSNFIFFGKTE
eukprot:gene4110-7396_t